MSNQTVNFTDRNGTTRPIPSKLADAWVKDGYATRNSDGSVTEISR